MRTGGYQRSSGAAAIKADFKYTEFWGREPDLILHSKDKTQPHIDIYRFPPKKVNGFFHKAPLKDQYIYISAGMSEADMPVKPASDTIPSRIELTVFSNEIYKNLSGDMDMAAWWLSFLAHLPFKGNDIFFTPGHTFKADEPIIPGSSMAGFFFGVTPVVNLKRLCGATANAKLMLQVVPISESEIKLAQNKGPDSLMDYFEKHDIGPIFDLNRKPFI